MTNEDFENGHDSDEDIDFSDLREQYEVRLEEGLDTFVVVDGLPVVSGDRVEKLKKYLLRKMNAVGNTREDTAFMPTNDITEETEGFAFVEFKTAEQAVAAVKQLNGTRLDKEHRIYVNKLTDIDRYGREGRIADEYTPPHIEDFQEKEHLRWWLGDPDARDQMAMFRGDNVGVFWNEKEDQPEMIVDRQHWTESFVQWSPLGTYLTSMHDRGVQLWGGKSWGRQKRLSHPGVNLVDFSPNEKFITTWSFRPIQYDETDPGRPDGLTVEEDGKNYIIWDMATAKPLRSFVTLDLPSPGMDEDGNPIKRKIQWPAFKWSADDAYVARMTHGQSISIYETATMKLLDKTSLKIEGINEFEWAPATPKRDGVKSYEQLLCYWTPELGSNPAKVGLMSIPSKEIVRTRNLFNVSDAKLHWQNQGTYVCVKVDRHSKSKKSLATNLEIFRVQEKGVPVEVVDSIKDTVINFAWEPKGNRFVLITTGEIPTASAVPPKTSVSFFCPERKTAKGGTGPPPGASSTAVAAAAGGGGGGGVLGNFKHIRTVDRKNSNAIYWSPKGRFVVVATVHSHQSFDLDFWDLDFEGEKDEKEKDLTANLQLMNTAEHYGVTDIEWDPTGRFVATSASMWKHSAENGYHIYNYSGQTLREEPVEKFKQFLWRPRPPTLLPKDEQKKVRRNLREYGREFDEQDAQKKSSATRAVVENRRRLLEEWRAWRTSVAEALEEEGINLADLDGTAAAEAAVNGEDGKEKGEVIEEIVEEIVDEQEEVVS